MTLRSKIATEVLIYVTNILIPVTVRHQILAKSNLMVSEVQQIKTHETRGIERGKRGRPSMRRAQSRQTKCGKKTSHCNSFAQTFGQSGATNTALVTFGRRVLSVKSSFVLSHISLPLSPDTPRYRNRPVVTGSGICNATKSRETGQGTLYSYTAN